MSCCFDTDALLRGRDRGRASISGAARNAHAHICALRLLRCGARTLAPARYAPGFS